MSVGALVRSYSSKRISHVFIVASPAIGRCFKVSSKYQMDLITGLRRETESALSL